MNSLFNKFSFKKAGLIACLFLCFLSPSNAHEWKFTATAQKAYDLTLDLQINEARKVLREPKTISEHYVLSLAEAIELLLFEDPSKFQEYQRLFQNRKDKKIKGAEADYQFYQAELRLQWAFIYLKFGQELDAAVNLKQAYQISSSCRSENPDYLPIRKTTGLIEIIIGSVPEKYNWVLGILGMQGSIPKGIEDLNAVKTRSSSFAFEASVLYALVHGFVFQQPDAALEELKKNQKEKVDNRTALLLGAALAIKNSESEKALQMLLALSKKEKGTPLYLVDYLKGEVYLHKAEYDNAVPAYKTFIKNYVGQNYIKDTHYKIGLCYWLKGDVRNADSAFEEAKAKGKEATEADKYAAKSLLEKDRPHIKLSKIRFYTDGGYYKEAGQLLDSITPTDIPQKRDQVEYYYRKARLAHKQQQLPPAKLFYAQTIDMAADENWYFAPNACLQLGYIAWGENNESEAKSFFEKALTYKKHEYKNSIDSKAKSALTQIKRK